MSLVVPAAFAERPLDADELSAIEGGQLFNNRCVTTTCGSNGWDCCLATDPTCTNHQQCTPPYIDCFSKVLNPGYGVCQYNPGTQCAMNQNIWCIKYQGAKKDTGVCGCAYVCSGTTQAGCQP
jgi:hypothetical protein